MPYTKNYDLDTDTTLGGDNASDYVAASQKAIKDYVDNHSGGGGANTDLSNLTATGEAHFLKNTATDTNSLTIGGTLSTARYSTNIGIGSSVSGSDNVALGYNASATGVLSVALGTSATASGQGSIAIGEVASSSGVRAIQIGTGTNSTNMSFYIGFGTYNNVNANYQLLDGTTGYIPNGRLLGLLQTIYPVGCVYLTTNSTCPLSSLFGTWSLVSSGRALWTGTGSNGNTTIAAGLPNITGNTDQLLPMDLKTSTSSGAIYTGVSGSKYGGLPSGSLHAWQLLHFDASQSNSIYGNSTTVQPPAYVVNVFRRTS